MAQMLLSLLSVLFPRYAMNSISAPVVMFSLDEESDEFGGEDDFFSGEDEEDEDMWFPGDDENGDDEFGNDEDFNY